MDVYNVILRSGRTVVVESDAASPEELVHYAMGDPDGWLVTTTVAIRCADVAAFEVPHQNRRDVRTRTKSRAERTLSDTY